MSFLQICMDMGIFLSGGEAKGIVNGDIGGNRPSACDRYNFVYMGRIWPTVPRYRFWAFLINNPVAEKCDLSVSS